MEIFWATITYYNENTWIAQTVILLLGLVLTTLLLNKPNKVRATLMKVYLIGVYAWIAIAYYAIYCLERGYNNILCYFWLLMTAIWIWDLISNFTPLDKKSNYTILAIVLMLMPLVYPLLSLARGLSFPTITTPIMPCAVATFTIGLLLYFSTKVNMFLVLFLCHWSLIGLTKTYFFDIPEDYLLVAVSVPAIYIFFRQYFLDTLDENSKPSAKVINILLIGLCVAIGVILGVTLIAQVTGLLPEPNTVENSIGL